MSKCLDEKFSPLSFTFISTMASESCQSMFLPVFRDFFLQKCGNKDSKTLGVFKNRKNQATFEHDTLSGSNKKDF